MALPVFPSFLPKIIDPLWFNVDKPLDDDSLLTKLEEEHQTALQNIAKKDNDLRPIGTTASEHFYDEEDEDEDEEGEDEDDSDTNEDDELDAEMMDDRESPVDADMEMNDHAADSPQWAL